MKGGFVKRLHVFFCHFLPATGVTLILSLWSNLRPSRYWQKWREEVTRVLGERKRLERERWTTRLTGHYTMSAVAHRMAGEQIRSHLPSGIVLDPAAADERGTYLVIVGFGYQQWVRPGWLPYFLGFNYSELATGVAGVKAEHGDAGGDCTAMLHLHLNSPLAWALGRLLGFPKHLGQIATSEQTYHVRSLLGRRRVEANFEPQGELEGPGNHTYNFDSFKRFFAQPALTRPPLGGLLRLSFNFDWSEACVQPINAKVHVRSHPIPGLQGGEQAWGYREGKPLEACVIHVPWEMKVSVL